VSVSELTLDQLGRVARGRSRHRPRDAEFLYGGPFPFIQTGDVKRANLYLTDYGQTYSEAGLAQSKLWPAGTLCITIAANIADTAILGIDACFPDSVIGFSPHPDKADARFVKYLFDGVLKSKYRSFTQGAAQDNLSQEKLLSIKFPVPQIGVQRRAADILAAYDNLIENNMRRKALLEKAALMLYREWFVHFRFPGHEHVKIIDGIPEGWVNKTASAAMDVLSGGTPKTDNATFWDGEIGFFTPKDATDNTFAFETEKRITEEGLRSCNSRLYPVDTIFITARGTVGKLNLALVPMAMNQSCYALRSKTHLSQHFIYLALKSAIEQVRARATGAVFDAIIVATFDQIPFVVPPEPLAKVFSLHVDSLFDQIANLVRQNKKLAQARDLLLPRLMNGEIAV
jgi:type I restriction enzyme S subunit